jgi:hypothetical protein
MAQLKAQRVPYEERIAKLDDVTHNKPDAEFVYAAYGMFVDTHPWLEDQNIKLKSIAREMFEDFRSFDEYTRDYAIARSEGLLLRYLSQVLQALVKTVPEAARTPEVDDAIAYFRTMIGRVDSSLVEAWETMMEPEESAASERVSVPAFDLATQPGLLRARIRSELHGLVRALSIGEFDEAASLVLQDDDDPWTAERFSSELAAFFEEYERIVFSPDARAAHRTTLRSSGPRTWEVFQTLVDPQGDGLWAIEGVIDLQHQRNPEGNLVRIRRIGP